jgi:hypothetical protein
VELTLLWSSWDGLYGWQSVPRDPSWQYQGPHFLALHRGKSLFRAHEGSRFWRKTDRIYASANLNDKTYLDIEDKKQPANLVPILRAQQHTWT